MRKVLIFGNSGSGKSTLAKKLRSEEGLAHLDLDTLAWEPTLPPERKSLIESEQEIIKFMGANDGWVIEGCYADLLQMAVMHASEVIFMNLSVDACIANAKSRAWEPHKYASKAAQDANLDMLIEWIAHYPKRTDTFSRAAHQDLYIKFPGKKGLITCNAKNT